MFTTEGIIFCIVRQLLLHSVTESTSKLEIHIFMTIEYILKL
jgi:hypothetical protein